MHSFTLAAAVMLSLLAGCPSDATSPTPPGVNNVVVFAAASLRDALQDAAAVWKQERGGEVTFNFGGSSFLAKQVEASRSADLLISASEEWADYLVKAQLNDGLPVTIASNSLAIIKRKGSPWSITTGNDLATLNYRHLALGDPQAVPAGKYARQYLESLTHKTSNVWEHVKDKVSPAVDVRFAMSQVEADPDVLGIVYRTDALISAQVEVAYAVPPEATPAIAYVAVAIKQSPNPGVGTRFTQWLLSDAARAVLLRRGFTPPATAQPSAP